MSFFVLEYLESQIRGCDTLIAEADPRSRPIFEAARRRLVREIERITDADGGRAADEPAFSGI